MSAADLFPRPPILSAEARWPRIRQAAFVAPAAGVGNALVLLARMALERAECTGVTAHGAPLVVRPPNG